MRSRSLGRDGGLVAQALLFAVVSVVAGVLVAGMMLPFAGSTGVAVREVARDFEDLPSVLATPPLPQQSVILTADGKRLATVYNQNRIVVPLGKISPLLQRAVVAVEDSRFYEHGGVDLRGTIRAAVTNVQSGGVEQGGSTLTQQYVRNVLQLSAENEDQRRAATEQTVARKLREMRFAIGLEKRLSKQQILEGYLNIAYFGAGAYGAEAAARRFYSTSAAKLTLDQAATIAGLVQNPVGYDPLRRPDLAQKRRDVVLQRMFEQKQISAADYGKAQSVALAKTLRPSEVRNGCTSSTAPFFCDYVLTVIAEDPAFGKTEADRRSLLARGGLTITTTLDSKIQATTQQAVDERIPRTDKSRKAAVAVVVEPGTGAIKAMAQNRDYGTTAPATSINYAVDRAHNGLALGVQPGSTFKAFVLAAALEKRIPVNTRLSSPSRKKFRNFRACGTGARFPVYAPPNSTGSGTFDLRTGTALSVNTFFVGLTEMVGLCRPAEITTALGLRDADGEPIDWQPSTVLGTAGVNPLAMAEAYATFAARGLHCNSTAITGVIDRTGKKLSMTAKRCQQVLDSAVADGVTYLLAGVVDGSIAGRTGKLMSLGQRPAAGKTGTTNDSASVWFMGYTPQFATAVAVFDPRGPVRYPLKNLVINGRYYSQVFGSTLPGPIWKQIMLAAHQGLPIERFPKIDTTVVRGTYTTVPDLRGLSVAQATERLRALGLNASVDPTPIDSTYPAGTVAATSPAGGKSVAPGGTVSLVVSTGVAPQPSPSPTPSVSISPSASPTAAAPGKPPKPPKPR